MASDQTARQHLSDSALLVNLSCAAGYVDKGASWRGDGDAGYRAEPSGERGFEVTLNLRAPAAAAIAALAAV